MPKDSPVHELFLEAFKFSNIIYRGARWLVYFQKTIGNSFIQIYKYMGLHYSIFLEGTQNGGKIIQIKHSEVNSPCQKV